MKSINVGSLEYKEGVISGEILMKKKILKLIDEICKDPTHDQKTATNIKMRLKAEITALTGREGK